MHLQQRTETSVSRYCFKEYVIGTYILAANMSIVYCKLAVVLGGMTAVVFAISRSRIVPIDER